MIIQQLLKLCSCECATGASLRPSTITGVYGDEVPPVLIPNTEVKLISADGTWLDTARELGWTRPGRVCRRRFPKQKHPTSVGCFCFNNHPEITLRKRNGKMRDDAIVPAERGASERLAFSRCVKERPRARRRLCCGGAAQTRISADRDASTPVSKTKSSHYCVSFLFCNSAPNTICRVRPRC